MVNTVNWLSSFYAHPYLWNAQLPNSFFLYAVGLKSSTLDFYTLKISLLRNRFAYLFVVSLFALVQDTASLSVTKPRTPMDRIKLYLPAWINH